jgi:hypothetical protein
VILFLDHRFAVLFSNPHDCSLAQDCFDAYFGFQRLFSPGCEDTSSVVAIVFRRLLSLFLHPNNAVANLSRPIRSKMVWNNSLGTATSAIWKTTCQKWHTTFAPILISFSRSVVNVQ